MSPAWINYPANKEYSTTWTLIIDSLKQHGISFEKRKEIADDIIERLSKPEFVNPLICKDEHIQYLYKFCDRDVDSSGAVKIVPKEKCCGACCDNDSSPEE